jgi:hypothetical protein
MTASGYMTGQHWFTGDLKRVQLKWHFSVQEGVPVPRRTAAYRDDVMSIVLLANPETVVHPVNLLDSRKGQIHWCKFTRESRL